MLTYGSIFSGFGMMDLGFERAGLQCAWQVEINEYARRVLSKNFPSVRRWDDVRTFPGPGDWSCSILAGGFPCKQTSNAAAVHGRRNGIDGSDSGLWHQMLRVVRAVRPEWVIVENPLGAATWKAEIKGGLEDAGFIVPDEPLELSAEMFGLPHRRRRLFWIADRHGKGLEITRQGGPCKADRKPGRAAYRNPWLPSLAGVVRVADGVPGGLDRRERINAIGNACCPIKAEWIGRQILEAMN